MPGVEMVAPAFVLSVPSGAWLSAHQKWNDLELDHCSGYLTEEQPKNIVLLSWGEDTATLQKENL